MALREKEKQIEIPKEVLDAARNIDKLLDGKEKQNPISADTVKKLAEHSPILAGVVVAANKNYYDDKTINYVKKKLKDSPEEKEIAKYLG